MEDTGNQFKATFSSINFYENIAGILMKSGATSLSNTIAASTERVSFYTVQGAEDAARLRGAGGPWPSRPTRAHLGEGVYAWGSKMEAKQYLNLKESAGIMNQEIVEFSISKRKFSRLNSKLLEYGPDAESFISKYSKIYGEGLTHNFDYIRGLTGNLGAEHYFNKNIFKKLKFEQ